MQQMIKGGASMPFMQKQPPSIDAITWKHGYNTNLGISRHS